MSDHTKTGATLLMEPFVCFGLLCLGVQVVMRIHVFWSKVPDLQCHLVSLYAEIYECKCRCWLLIDAVFVRLIATDGVGV